MLRETIDILSLSECSWTKLDHVSRELRLYNITRAWREYRFNLLKIEFAGCSLSLISTTFIFRDWKKIESQRCFTARCNVRVTHRKYNVFFMIVRFSIIASSSRPSLPHLRKNGIAKSYVLIQKNEKSVEKERGRGRERRRLRLSVKYTSAFASIAFSEELPMDDDLRRFWCVIPMADIELLPARTHQRSNVRRSQPIWRSPKRRTT